MARPKDPRYEAAAEPELVTVPATRVLAVEGMGGPDAPAFRKAVGGLYGIAYTLKFALKPRDMKVGALEGLWWTDSARPWHKAPRSKWHWRLLIAVPSFVTAGMVRKAQRALEARRGPDAASGVALETLREGRCVQIMHVGPYATERASIDKMDRLATDRGLAKSGPHHEIYLGDPRRTAPSRLRTILRQPVKRGRVTVSTTT